MTRRAFGLAGMLLMLVLAKLAGAQAANGFPTHAQAVQLADISQQLLAAKGLPCTDEVRVVAVDGPAKSMAICGFSQAYEINWDSGEITVLVYP
jgi:hypothetical protein